MSGMICSLPWCRAREMLTKKKTQKTNPFQEHCEGKKKRTFICSNSKHDGENKICRMHITMHTHIYSLHAALFVSKEARRACSAWSEIKRKWKLRSHKAYDDNNECAISKIWKGPKQQKAKKKCMNERTIWHNHSQNKFYCSPAHIQHRVGGRTQ